MWRLNRPQCSYTCINRVVKSARCCVNFKLLLLLSIFCFFMRNWLLSLHRNRKIFAYQNCTNSYGYFLLKIQSFDECSKKQTWTDGYSEYCGKYLSADAIEEESSLSSSGKVLYSNTRSYLLNTLPSFDRTLMESTYSSRLFEMPYFREKNDHAQ